MLNRVSAKVFLLQVCIIMLQTYSFIVCTIHRFSWLHVGFFVVGVMYMIYIADLLYHHLLMQVSARKSYIFIQAPNHSSIMCLQVSCMFLIFVFLQLSDYTNWYFYSGIQLLPYVIFLPLLTYDLIAFGKEGICIERVWLPYDHVLNARIHERKYHVRIHVQTYDQMYTLDVKKKNLAYISKELQSHIKEDGIIMS